MEKILSFDMAAMVIYTILIFSVFFRKMYRTTEDRIFLMYLLTGIVSTIYSFITSWAIKFPDKMDVYSRYICHDVYLVARNIVAPIYCIYIIALTDTWHKIYKKTLMIILSTIPYLTICALVISNYWTKLIFYINDDLEYVRGQGFIALYLIAVFYIFIALVELFEHKNSVPLDKYISIAAVVPFTLLAVAVQYTHPNVTIEMFATSIACLMMTITVQRPEDSIDPLTGLNKDTMYTFEINRGFRNEKKMHIFMIDIDNIDTLEDMIGYDTTHKMLKKIARKLISIDMDLRTKAGLYYIGNGKFRCVLNELHFDKSNEMVEKINQAFKDEMEIDNFECNLITYVCVVKCPEDVNEFEKLIQFEKEYSKYIPYSGDVIYAKHEMNNRQFNGISDVSTQIENGLINKKFEVYYQPIFSIKENRFTSAEALLRLRDDDGNFISPDIFIPVAEDNGSIHRIGDFVMEEVCKFIASDEFVETGIDYIEVNLSVSQCMQINLAEKILDIMEQYKVRPEQINLEITETAAIHAQNIMMTNLEKINNAGISLSLDDYGTGYSNIQRVASLPLKIVKLDKSFVDMQDNPRMWVVLRNTIKMLKEMAMEIVVEGVETAQMAKKFADLECEYIQGYYYSKPVPETDFVGFVRSNNN